MPVPNSGDSAQPLTIDSAASAIESLLPDEDTESTTDATPGDGEDSPTAEAADDTDEAAESASEDESQDEDEPTGEQTPQPRKVKVKQGDRDEEVSEDELVKGYLRQQDYTRKTMEHAERRKAFEQQELPAVRAERQQYHTRLTELDQALTALTQEPDWDKLRLEDPAQFAQTHAAWQVHERRLAALRAERARVAQQIAEDQSAQFAQHVAREQELLVEKIPEWKDAEAGKKGRAELRDYAKALGYSDEDLKSVADHRVMVVLRKAMLYDRAEKAKAEAKPKVQARIEQAKVATPGAAASTRPKTPELTRRKQRLAKTGSTKDAAAAIELMLGD